MKQNIKEFDLTAEEKKIEKERSNGLYVQIDDFEEEKRKLMNAARVTPKKTKTITIRLPEITLLKIRKRAQEEGIPYQTLIGSILHKAM